MSKAKHTPGPWIWGDDFCGLYGAGPDKEVLSYFEYENMWLSSGEYRDANARLIAAAPDLLEALETVMRLSGHYVAEHPVIAAKVTAAIAKAKGE